MKIQEIKFKNLQHSYSVLIGKNIFSILPGRIKLLCPKAKKIAIIVDKNIPKKIIKNLKNKFKSYELFLITFSSNEKTKSWLPEETLNIINDHLIAIKGPLTTPVGGGMRSLNVALRQLLDLYACVRPVRWFPGVPSPVKMPELVDMVIFRENTEDIYAGIEFQAETDELKKLLNFIDLI